MGQSKPGRLPSRIPFIGERFACLVVISEPWLERRRRRVRCRCDCSKVIEVKINNLLTSNAKSCGCVRKKKIIARNWKHGGAQRNGMLSEYKTWTLMIHRCSNSNLPDWKNYGGRGITVCQRWLDSFADFLLDMGSKPGPEYSIDRINVNGNYEPNNCKWATDKEQANNTRRNRRLTHGGRTMTMNEWAKELGISASTMHGRLQRNPVEVALSMPRQNKGRGAVK